MVVVEEKDEVAPTAGNGHAEKVLHEWAEGSMSACKARSHFRNRKGVAILERVEPWMRTHPIVTLAIATTLGLFAGWMIKWRR